MRRSNEFNVCDYRSRHMAVQEFAVYKMKIVWLTSDSNCNLFILMAITNAKMILTCIIDVKKSRRENSKPRR